MSDPLYVNSAGSLVPVAPEGIEEAVNMGWVPASPKQAADFDLQQKYGSTGQQAIAGLEGVGRGLSLGLSTAVETHLGVPKQDIAGREEANPWTAGIGEGAGFLVPGGGAGFALKAGKTAARILGEGAVAKLAGSAVEGAFYGAGHVVHEAALGDPNLTAQSALATVGLSAALLGGASAAGRVLGTVAREYMPKDLGAKVIEMAREAEAHSNFNATNAMPNLIKKTMRGKGSGATALGLEARELGILKNPLSDSPDAILDRAKGIKDASGQTLDQIARGASVDGPITTWDRVYQDVHEPISKALRAQGATVGLADQFDAFLGKYAEAYGGRDLTVEGLWNLRKDVGDFIYKNGKVLDPWVKDLNTPIKRVYDHIDSLISDGISDASGKDVLAKWTKANRAYEVGATFATLAESGIERSAANNPLHLSGMIGAAAGLAGHGLGVGAITGAASEALRRRGASATGFAANLVRTALGDEAEAVAGRTAEMVAAVRRASSGAGAIGVSDLSQETRARLLQQLHGLNLSNPGSAGAGLSEQAQSRLMEELGKLNLATPSEVSAAGPGLSGDSSAALLSQLHELNLVDPSDAALRGLSAEARAKLEAQLGTLNVRPDSRIGPAPHQEVAQTVTLPVESAPRAVTVLAALERMNSATARKIESAAGALIKGESTAGIAKVFRAEDAQAVYGKRVKDIQRLAQDPEQLHRAMVAQTEDWQTHAPQTAQAMSTTSARAINFLATKIPKPPLAGPLAPKWIPSRDEMAHFNRYYEAVEHPLEVLRQAQAGTLTNEGIEALEAVHPALLQKIRETLIEKLGKGTVPYQSRLMLSTLMGEDLDGSLRAQALTHAAQGFQPMLPPAMPKSGKPMTLSNRTQTPMQRSVERGG